MIQRRAFIARESSSRMSAVVLMAAVALRCQAPADEGLFDSSPSGSGGSGGAPSVGTEETPVEVPFWGLGVIDPGSGESTTGSGEVDTPLQPPLVGAGGTPQSGQPSMGAAGAMDSPDPGNVPAALDAGAEPVVEDCVLGEFQAPEPLTGLEQSLNPALAIDLWAPDLSADGLTLLFAVGVNGVDEQIVASARASRGPVFGPVTAVAGINSAGLDGAPMLSADGLALYFYSTRAGGLGSRDLWVTTRADTAAPFTAPVPIAGVNSPAFDHAPWISSDELTLLWATDRSGGPGQGDIWIARRNVRSDGFSGPAPLNGVNSALDEGRGVLDSDGLTIYFSSNRAGGVGDRDLWVATRNDPADAFSQVTDLAAVNSPSMDSDPMLSADDRELMFSSARDGRIRLWRSVRDCE
jgi:hypothetical protein